MIVGEKLMRNLKISSQKTKNKIFLIVFACFVLSILLSLSLGAARLTLGQLVQAVKDGAGGSFEGNIFWYVRFPST